MSKLERHLEVPGKAAAQRAARTARDKRRRQARLAQLLMRQQRARADSARRFAHVPPAM
jgi:hypothetical protein